MSIRTRFGGVLAAVVLGSTLSGGLAASSETGVGVGPDLARVLGDGRLVEAAIATDVDLRSQLHLPRDREYVRSLYASPERTTGNRLYGALFTEAEAAEVAARFDLSGEIASIWNYYRRNPSRASEFAGALIDHAAGGKLVIYTTLAPDKYSDLGWRTSLKRPDRLELRPAAVSFQELDDLRLRLQRAMQSRDPIVQDATGLHIDVAANAVRVYIEPESLARRGAEARRVSLAARFPGGRLVVAAKEREPGAGAKAVIAGRGWGYVADQEWCTTAFKVRRVGSDETFMLTAGHCMNGDPALETRRAIYRADSLVGRRTDFMEYRDQGVADVGLLREMTDKGHAGDFLPYVRHNGYRVPIRGTTSDYTADGELRCVTGRKTGTNCGTISNPVYDVRYENFDPVLHFYDLVKFRARTTCGDSGAPVYAYIDGEAYANGVYGGGGPQDACPPAGETFKYSFYSKWSNIPEAWGVRLSRAPAEVSP